MFDKHFEYIFFDADDTLWENEIFFREAEDSFACLFKDVVPKEDIMRTLYRYEEENIPLFGYGSKTFLTAMSDTALEIFGDNIPGYIYSGSKKIISRLYRHSVTPLPGVHDTLSVLSSKYKLIVATKGDNMEQHLKFEKSGLEQFFSGFEVMHNKDEKNYLRLASRYGICPNDMLMAGNSVKSDIAPVISIGGYAIHIPHGIVWSHEFMEMPESDHIYEVSDISELKDILD